MDIQEIKAALQDSNPQERMKGIRELRNYEADIAAPLLLDRVKDEEFLVRSFVAMGLGKKRSDRGFAALLEMIQSDKDPNVRAEAANAISYYGEKAIPHLKAMFEADEHWLVRKSILAAMADYEPSQELLEMCEIGLRGDDEPVMESCLSCLGMFADTEREESAVELLLSCVKDESWRIRVKVARALGQYKNLKAIAALNQLKTDDNHRVVAAVLESLI